MATKFPIPVHLNPRTLTSSYPSEKWSQLCVPSCLQIDGCLSHFNSRWIDLVEFQHSANNEQFESKSKIGNGQFTLSPDSERIAQTKCAKIFCLATFPSGCQQKMQVSSADSRDTHEAKLRCCSDPSNNSVDSFFVDRSFGRQFFGLQGIPTAGFIF
jgi:hypothetical protein